jgi:hypothetical protein
MSKVLTPNNVGTTTSAIGIMIHSSLFFSLRHPWGSTDLIKGPLKVTVPNHKAILPKTLQNVLRQANVAVEKFHEVL